MAPKETFSVYANSQMFRPGPNDPKYANFPVRTKSSAPFDHLTPQSPEFDHLNDPAVMLSELEKEIDLNSIRMKSFEVEPSEEIPTSRVISEAQTAKQELKLNLELDSVIDSLQNNLELENRLLTPTYANGPQTHIYNLDKPKALEYCNSETVLPDNAKSEKNAIKIELKLQKELVKLEKKYVPASKLDVYDANKSKQQQTNKPQPAVKRKLPKTPDKSFSQPNLFLQKIPQTTQTRKLPETTTTTTTKPVPHVRNNSTLVKVLPTLEQDVVLSSGARPKRIAPPPPTPLSHQISLPLDVTQSLCVMPQRTNQNSECKWSEYIL